MPRTDTRTLYSFSRTSQITYDLSPSSNVVTISLPPKSNWTSGLHWHETHTEYLQVIKGKAQITLEGVTKIYGPEDGHVKVDRGARHEWKLAPGSDDAARDDDQYALVVKEWTDPADGEKEIFFRSLSSVFMEPPRLEAMLTLQLFCTFQALDNYPVIFATRWRRVE